MTDTEALEADAEATEAGGVDVDLVTSSGTVTLRVPVTGKWPASALRSLRERDVDSWAEKVLDDEDYTEWQRLDPTVDEVAEFFQAATEALGEDAGKSSRSQRRSKPTRKR